MSFPWHHGPWREAAEFLAGRARAGDLVLAPDPFWWIVSPVERYVPENLVTDRAYDWVVLDGSDMGQIPRPFLEHVAATMTPVLANDAVVVWSADRACAPVGDVKVRMAWFWPRLAWLGVEPAEPNRYVQDRAIAAAPRITRHADLSDRELRDAMDRIFRTTGYVYPTRRDRVYRDDVERHVRGFLEHSPGNVLDICSGGEPFVEVPESVAVVRTELSEVGIRLAKDEDASRPGLTHVVMDAQRIAFPDASFDDVIFIDAIEHVRDASVVFHEVARVLAPSGRLLVTFANRNSVNQVLTRCLGYPEFVTNFQHIREFTFAEISELLECAGFEIEETAGITLYPYWAVPGVDEIVRHVIDDDPEFVELMSELGRRVGAEHAYTGVVEARRRPAPTPTG